MWGRREETCRIDLSVSVSVPWPPSVDLGQHGAGVRRNRGLGGPAGGGKAQRGGEPGNQGRALRYKPAGRANPPCPPATSVLIPGGPQPPPLLLPPDLGHEVGIGGGLGSQVLGLGDVEEDVHDVSGDVQGQSDLGAPVTLGLVLGWPPLELCLGWVLVPGAASPATTAATPGARKGPFLCVLLLLPLLVLQVSAGQGGEGPLDQQRCVLPLALLGLAQGCVEAAEAGPGFGGPLGEARLGGPEEQQQDQQEGGRHKHLSLLRKRAIRVRGS